MNNNLTEKAMLIRLSISQWTARKYDPKVTAEIIKSHNADPDSGRFNKMLVDLDCVKVYQKIAGESRTFHYSNTLSWGDDDSRILPAANYLPYTNKMREFAARFEGAVRDFIGLYPSLIDRAKNSLNGLFDPKDYPAPAELAGKYGFKVVVSPLPDAADFRVTLGQAEVDRIRDEIQETVKASIQGAIKDLWARLHSVVRHLADKLKDKDAIFRDSLINNIRELTDLLPRLNIVNDSDLNAMVDEVKRDLAGQNPETLRDDKYARFQAAADAEKIIKKMAAYMGS